MAANLSIGDLQAADELGNLVLKELDASVVPQDKISQLDFACQRQLLGDSLLGERVREASLLQSGDLLGRSTRHTHREIKPIL